MTTSPRTLHNVALWDGERAYAQASLSWDGDRITAVTPATAGLSSSVEAVDESPGLSVIPGLVDTHVHLDTAVGAPTADRAWPIMTPPEERSLHVAGHTLAAVRGGVTTMRDLAAESPQLAVGRAFEAGALSGPRLYGGCPVGMTAGHGDLFVPPHYPHRAPLADSPDECRKLVRTWARTGAHAIKIYTSGGVLSMGDKVSWRNQTDAEISATVDEAHALGMLVAAHTHTADGLERALRLGADSIEHGTGMTPELMVQLVERQVPVAPTLLIHQRMRESGVVSAEALAKSDAVDADRAERLRVAGRMGVRFVLGTDANGVFTGFGADQMAEVRAMATAFGWSAERALQAATSDAADAIGIGDTVGRLIPGRGADFVVLRGTPWREIAELDASRIVAVVSRGRVLAGELPAA